MDMKSFDGFNEMENESFFKVDCLGYKPEEKIKLYLMRSLDAITRFRSTFAYNDERLKR
jgi:hypothetical protein